MKSTLGLTHSLPCLACKDKPAFSRYFQSCTIPGCTSPTAEQENLLQKQNHRTSVSSSTSKDEKECHQPHQLPVRPMCTPRRHRPTGLTMCWDLIAADTLPVTSLNGLSDHLCHAASGTQVKGRKGKSHCQGSRSRGVQGTVFRECQ